MDTRMTFAQKLEMMLVLHKRSDRIYGIARNQICLRGLKCNNKDCRFHHPQWLSVMKNICIHALVRTCGYDDCRREHKTWEQIREATAGAPECWVDFFN